MTTNGDLNEERDRAVAYLILGQEYLAAARSMQPTLGERPTRPFWSLLAHGLELVIKARLRASGWSESRLLAVNHDLEASIRHADLTRDRPLAGLVHTLGPPHAMQVFRYPAIQAPRLPDVGSAIAIADRLIEDSWTLIIPDVLQDAQIGD